MNPSQPSLQALYMQLLELRPQDRVILEQPKEGPAASTWGPFGHLSENGRWLLLGQWTGGSSNVVEVVVSSLRRKLGDRAPGVLEPGVDARRRPAGAGVLAPLVITGQMSCAAVSGSGWSVTYVDPGLGRFLRTARISVPSEAWGTSTAEVNTSQENTERDGADLSVR